MKLIRWFICQTLFQNDADPQIYDKIYSNLCGLLAHGDLNNKEYDLLKEVLYELERI